MDMWTWSSSFDMNCRLVLNISHHITTYELQDTYPFLSRAVLARVRSGVFAKDACNLISWFKEQGKQTCPKGYANLITHFDYSYTFRELAFHLYYISVPPYRSQCEADRNARRKQGY